MLWRELRFAARAATRNPSYSLLIVAVLAIGIGANTAIFTLANAAFFRALPYPHAERLAFLWQNNQRTGESEGAVSYPNYADWRAQSRSFEDMAFIMFAKEMLSGSGTQAMLNSPNGPERVPAALVSTNFSSVLGVQPLLGRAFAPDDALHGKTSVVIIGYALCNRASPAIRTRSASASALAMIRATGLSASCLRALLFRRARNCGSRAKCPHPRNSISACIRIWASSAD